jgi:hypothetical protein
MDPDSTYRPSRTPRHNSEELIMRKARRDHARAGLKADYQAYRKR